MKRLLLTIVCMLSLAASLLAVPVTDIQVINLGEGELEPDMVRAFTSVKIGDEFSRTSVSRDVKALQKSSRFSFVSTRLEQDDRGVVLIYEVKLRPRLRNLAFKGNDELSDSKLEDLMELSEGSPVDDTILAVAIQKVKEKYIKKNYPFVRADWSIDDVPGTMLSDVTVTIEEGSKALIRKVRFDGGEALKKRELKKLVSQKPWHLLSWMTGSGKFNPDQLSTDVDTVRNAFFDRGYLDVKVDEPVITPYRKSGLSVTFPIEQGDVYQVGRLAIEGATLFPESELRRLAPLEWGDVASLGTIRKAASDIQDYYGSRGYIRTRVEQILDANPETHLVDITYKITEGNLAYIRNIDIIGNSRTRDKVIRRELVVYPGNKYNEVKIRRSENRLRNLGYFNTVFSAPEPTETPSYYDLTFSVDEKKTGQFVIGAGFSSVDDLIGFVELSQGNFDLFGYPNFTGGGQKIKFRAQLGTERNDIEFSFTEPWFMDRKLSMNLAAFRSERRFLSDEYNQVHTGGGVTFGKQLFGYHRGSIGYRFEEIEVKDLADDASELIRAEEGSRTKSSLKFEHIYDSRNSVFVPTRGTRLVSSAMIAGGPLGAETDLYQLETRLSQYFPLWFDHVLSFRGSLGVVDEYGDSDSVPIFDREFLGGARTLRGFRFRDVGPKDETGEPVGGKSSWFASAEYTVPVVEKIRFAAFYDIGMVAAEEYDFEFSEYNSDYGIGIRFDLPAFPLRLDYAWPLEADEFNDRSSGRFNFLIGYTL